MTGSERAASGLTGRGGRDGDEDDAGCSTNGEGCVDSDGSRAGRAAVAAGSGAAELSLEGVVAVAGGAVAGTLAPAAGSCDTSAVSTGSGALELSATRITTAPHNAPASTRSPICSGFIGPISSCQLDGPRPDCVSGDVPEPKGPAGFPHSACGYAAPAGAGWHTVALVDVAVASRPDTAAWRCCVRSESVQSPVPLPSGGQSRTYVQGGCGWGSTGTRRSVLYRAARDSPRIRRGIPQTGQSWSSTRDRSGSAAVVPGRNRCGLCFTRRSSGNVARHSGRYPDRPHWHFGRPPQPRSVFYEFFMSSPFAVCFNDK